MPIQLYLQPPNTSPPSSASGSSFLAPCQERYATCWSWKRPGKITISSLLDGKGPRNGHSESRGKPLAEKPQHRAPVPY